jgi:L-methionine (R)-S-oxide reductase
METGERKSRRYSRIIEQLSGLLSRSDDSLARMATVAALLHHKMDGFFWTGFYFLKGTRLVVGPYQGPVACQELEYGKGVCWAAVNKNETVVVEDVDKFPGHIACDPRSRSEIVVPVRNEKDEIVAVLDVDSNRIANFDEVDARYLQDIVSLIYR